MGFSLDTRSVGCGWGIRIGRWGRWRSMNGGHVALLFLMKTL